MSSKSWSSSSESRVLVAEDTRPEVEFSSAWAVATFLSAALAVELLSSFASWCSSLPIVAEAIPATVLS